MFCPGEWETVSRFGHSHREASGDSTASTWTGSRKADPNQSDSCAGDWAFAVDWRERGADGRVWPGRSERAKRSEGEMLPAQVSFGLTLIILQIKSYSWLDSSFWHWDSLPISCM